MGTLIPSKARPGAPWRARHAGDDYGAPDQPDWRDVDWRPHLHQHRIGGRSVNFVDYGEARDGREAVVFIHGLGGCWQNWLENIPRFAASGRRVIGIDLPGFGFSELPAEGISISGYGQCVNELCDELELGEVALVGNSMGGFVSAETAIQFPERVARLVLVSAAGIATADLMREPILAGARVAAILGTRSAAKADWIVRRPRLRAPLYFSFIRYPSRIRTDLLYEITSGAGRSGFLPALEAITAYDFRDRLGEIRNPTLIVWGSDDTLLPRRDAKQFESAIRGSQRIILDDTGHTAMIERPRTFNDCVLEFLDQEPEPAHSEAEVEAAGARRASSEGEGGGGANGGPAAVSS